MKVGKKESVDGAAADNGVPHFTISGEITMSTYEAFTTFYQKAVNEKAKRAIVFINSPGGYTVAAAGISEIMTSSNIKFYTSATGWCCSAGLHILAHGDVRCVTKDCVLMYHKLMSFAGGNPDEILATGKRLEKQQRLLQRSFARRTRKNATWWNRKARGDENKMYWFYSKDAKTLGVVDHIGLPEVEIVEKVVEHNIKIKVGLPQGKK